MSLPNPSEFQSVDGFYEPVDQGVLFSIPPMLIVGVLLLILLAGLAGWFLGRRKRADDDPTQAIYDAIKKAVTAAAGAPRDSVVITARHLKTVLDERLGAVRRLGHGVYGPYHALDEALEGFGEEEKPHKPDHDDDHKTDDKGGGGPLSGARKVTINARNFVLNATHGGPADDDHDDDRPGAGHGGGHDDKHAGGHGDDHGAGHSDHGPRKRLDGKAQTAAIRSAVHDFSDYWSDKPARLKDLREARKQLTTTPPASSDKPVWEKSKSGH